MKTNRIINNAAWMIGCKIVQSCFALVINALSARYLGPSNYGLLNYAASLVAFILPIASLGLSETLIDGILRHPDNEGEIIGSAILMSLSSSVLCIIGLFSFALFTSPNQTLAITVVVLYSLVLISQSLELIQYWFHAKYLSKYVSLAGFFAYILISIYKFLLLFFEKDIRWFTVSYALDYLLIAAILFTIYFSKKGQAFSISKTAVLFLWNQSKHYIIPGLMGLVLAQSDRIMIRFICGDTELGYYSAATSIAGIPSFVFSAIITSFRPSILEVQALTDCYQKRMTKLYGIITYFALTQAVAITFLAQPIVKVLYGADYVHAIPVLQLTIWYTIFSYIGAVRMVSILAEGKQRYLWIISFSGMLLNVFLNTILIPKYQSSGAAFATVITQIFTNIILVYLIKPLRNNIWYIANGLRINNLIEK